MNNPLIYEEHEAYTKKNDGNDDIIFEPKDIGQNIIYKEQKRYFNDAQGFGYYIEAMWLDTVPKEGGNSERLPVIITPKIKNIDFMAMFLACLKHIESREGFDEIYKIYFDEEFIQYKDKNNLPELEPLLIAHFIYYLEPLIRKGLKHNFVHHEDNISTIKGKLLFNQHLKKNLSQNRNHKAYCQFAQYDMNCIENRILKKALTICQKSTFNYSELTTKLAHCLTAFQEVSNDISHIEIKHIKVNPLYKDYKPAIEIAKQIIRLRRQTEGQQNFAPPFWIDMPLLFERYVYGLMLDNPSEWGEILYQKRTRRGIPDFLLLNSKIIADTLNSKIIADTKYRIYEDDSVKTDHARQLSAYSRELQIRKILGFRDDDYTMIPCLIIYPKKDGSLIADEKSWENGKGYSKFYKLGVCIPNTNKIKEFSNESTKN